jgi:hypothetical protein
MMILTWVLGLALAAYVGAVALVHGATSTVRDFLYN